MKPRKKPRRPTHRIVQDCVVAVAQKRPVRAAFAICVSQQQKLGRIVPGTLKLTRKGRRLERALATGKSAKKRAARFERVLAKARRARGRTPRPNPTPREASYLIQHRPVDGAVGAWSTIDTASSKARGVEAMLSAEGLRELRWGDLVRLTDGDENDIALAVMTSRGLAKAPTMPRILAKDGDGWVEAWEGDYTNAEHMVSAAKRVRADWARIIGACVGCARASLPSSPARRSELAVQTVEAWLSGVREPLSKLEEVYAGAGAESWRDPLGASFAPTITLGLLLSTYRRDTPEKVMVAAATSLARQSERPPYRDIAGVQRATANSLHSLANVVRRSLPLSAMLLAGHGEMLPFRYVRQSPGQRR